MTTLNVFQYFNLFMPYKEYSLCSLSLFIYKDFVSVYASVCVCVCVGVYVQGSLTEVDGSVRLTSLLKCVVL